MMLGKPSPPFCIPRWLENVKINKLQTLIQISYKVQELWWLSLTDHNMLDNCTSNPYLSKTGWFACQSLGNVDMHMLINSLLESHLCTTFYLVHIHITVQIHNIAMHVWFIRDYHSFMLHISHFTTLFTFISMTRCDYFSIYGTQWYTGSI